MINLRSCLVLSLVLIWRVSVGINNFRGVLWHGMVHNEWLVAMEFAGIWRAFSIIKSWHLRRGVHNDL